MAIALCVVDNITEIYGMYIYTFKTDWLLNCKSRLAKGKQSWLKSSLSSKVYLMVHLKVNLYPLEVSKGVCSASG